MKRANENARAPRDNLDAGLDRIWAAMESCMNRGLGQAGTLPGGLKVKRRAAEIHRQLVAEHGANSLQPHRIMDWLSVYAMAVNEENAAGGRVVTAPTNGAAGVIPAVIRYYLEHCRRAPTAKACAPSCSSPRRSAASSSTTPRSRARRSAARAKSARPRRWRRRVLPRRSARPTRRSRTPPRSRSSIISA